MVFSEFRFVGSVMKIVFRVELLIIFWRLKFIIMGKVIMLVSKFIVVFIFIIVMVFCGRWVCWFR